MEKDLMRMFDLVETVDQLAWAISIRCYGHVLRKDKNDFLRRALDFLVKWVCQWNLANAVVEQSIKVGLNQSDANDRSTWRFGNNAISGKMR